MFVAKPSIIGNLRRELIGQIQRQRLHEMEEHRAEPAVNEFRSIDLERNMMLKSPQLSS